jgi:hypothetical protein
MPIPDERLPQLDESDEEAMENPSVPGMRDETDELEFESAEVDDTDDEMLDDEAIVEPDTAGFGFGDPAE